MLESLNFGVQNMGSCDAAASGHAELSGASFPLPTVHSIVHNMYFFLTPNCALSSQYLSWFRERT